MFTSAVSIFAAGSALAWVKDTLCRDLAIRQAPDGGAMRGRRGAEQ